MNGPRFLNELQDQIRMAGLEDSAKPTFRVLEEAVPYLSKLLQQMTEDERISPQFKKLLTDFIKADCFELHCIRDLMFGYHKLEQSGLNKRSEIRFIKEIHAVVDCILLISNTMNNLRKHTRLLENMIHPK